MEGTLSDLACRDATLAPYKHHYASMTGDVAYVTTKAAHSGPAMFFTLENITCRVGGKTIAIDHTQCAIFGWQVHLDDTMVRVGNRVEIYGLIERYTRRSDDTIGYGIKRLNTLRRASR